MDGKVLFVCIHNSCRSIMAEAIFNAISKKWIAESAGIDKSKEIDGYTRKMLEEKGFRVKERPEGMDEKDLDEFEVVVAVCDSACVSIPGKRVIKWNIPDPSGTSPENYRRIFSMLENKIRELLIELNDVD